MAVTKLDRQIEPPVSHLPARWPAIPVLRARNAGDTTGIYLGSLDSAETRRLTPADTPGVYLSSGWLLWVRAGTLVAQRLDLERKALTGDPVTLADPVAFDAASSASAVSVSAAGLVAYRAGGANRRQLAWFDRSGKALGTMGAPDENSLVRSPRFARWPPGGGIPHGAGQHRHLASGRNPHEPIHVRCGEGPLPHLVPRRQAGSCSTRTAKGHARPLSETLQRRRRGGTARGIAAGQDTERLVRGRPVHSLSTASTRKRAAISGCCRRRAIASRGCS